MALDSFFHNKIESLKLEIIQGQAVLRRLEAQRNDYNSRVRLLREELGLLQQPGSYVGEVVKVMGTKKVLVKVHPEGKYGILHSHPPTSTCLILIRFPLSRRYRRQRRRHQAYRRQTSVVIIRFIQAGKDAALIRGSAGIFNDGREGPRQHI
jgi:hypothetical protein